MTTQASKTPRASILPVPHIISLGTRDALSDAVQGEIERERPVRFSSDEAVFIDMRRNRVMRSAGPALKTALARYALLGFDLHIGAVAGWHALLPSATRPEHLGLPGAEAARHLLVYLHLAGPSPTICLAPGQEFGRTVGAGGATLFSPALGLGLMNTSSTTSVGLVARLVQDGQG